MTLVLWPGLASVPPAATFPAVKAEIKFDGSNWTDVTPYADFSGGKTATISRGSSRVESPVIRYDAGKCSIPLDNTDRRFDPTNLDGPYVSGAAASSLQWLADAANVHSMFGIDPATTRQFFDNNRGFLMGSDPATNPVQDGLAANPVLNYKSYAKLQADISAGAIGGFYHWLLYDPENWATSNTNPLFGCSVSFPAGMTSAVGTMKACKIFNVGVPGSWPGPGGPVPAGVTTPLVVIRITLTGSAPWISSSDQTALAKFFGTMPLTGTPIVSINQEGEAPRFGYTAAQVRGSHNTAYNIFKAHAPSNAIYCQDLQTFSASAGGLGAAFPNYVCCAANGQQDLPLYLLDWYPTSNSTNAVNSITPAVTYIQGLVTNANLGAAECNFTTDDVSGITWTGGTQAQWFADAWAYAISNNFLCMISYFLNAHNVPWPPDGGQSAIDELALINSQSGTGGGTNPTPQAERNDPWTYMTNFCTLAHAHGYQVILTPGRDLGNVTTSVRPKNPGETLDQWYIRTGIATTAAAVGDVFEVQDQSNGLNLPEFTSFFTQAYNQAKTSHAATPVWCGLSTNFGDATQLMAAAQAVPQAQGFWFNMIGDITTSDAFFRLAIGLSGGGTTRTTQVRPMVPIRVSATFASVTYRLFSGFADAWTLSYSVPSDADAQVDATDGFKLLAAQPRAGRFIYHGPGETSDQRVRRILDDANWSPVNRNIQQGAATLQPTILGFTGADIQTNLTPPPGSTLVGSGTNIPDYIIQGPAPGVFTAATPTRVHVAAPNGTPLDELYLTTETEMGELFIDGNGFLNFRGRRGLFTDTRSLVSQATFGDDPNVPTAELPYASLTPQYDDSILWNAAVCSNVGGVLMSAADSTSVVKYGVHTFDSESMIADTDWQALAYAQFVVQQFKDPDLRFSDMSVDPRAQPTDLFPQVLGRQIGDRITAIRRPPGGGQPITRDVIIRGITHQFSESTWLTSFVFQDASDLVKPFTIGDSDTGVIGDGILGF